MLVCEKWTFSQFEWHRGSYSSQSQSYCVWDFFYSKILFQILFSGGKYYEKIYGIPFNRSNGRSFINRLRKLLFYCYYSSQITTAAPSSEAASSEEASSEAENTADADGSYTIGIGQFAEHGSLDNCREGFLEGLAAEGIEEGKNLTVLYQNAQADGGTSAQIANTFAGKDVDLMCGIATPMAQAEYSVAMKSDIPVIFTAVTDPVAAELANADGIPIGEITGTSDKLPVEQQLKMIREILPDAKTIGIMYTTSEVNSESAIAEYKELAPNYDFEIVDSGISSSADIPLAADLL